MMSGSGGTELDEDRELVIQALSGSSAAFARLVSRHQQAVRSFLRRLGGPAADADDLAQETFVTVWRRLGQVRADQGVRPWLFGIAYRKWLTLRRSDARRGARDAGTLEAQAVVHSGSDDRLDASAALAVLAPEERACVALCLAAEFSHAEAAQALGLPLGTVKSHVTRGRARLLELLGASDERR
ncbi:MAG TPA: RNA polymerase sigma factor [Caulobacteraceae bacterium]